MLLQGTIIILVISNALSLRGITFIGEPQTFAHKYGWQTLAIIIIGGLGIAFYSRKADEKKSNLVIVLSILLFIMNVIITNLFTYNDTEFLLL